MTDDIEVFEAKLVPPTKEQQKEMVQRQKAFELETVRDQRRAAYTNEADPLAFKVLRGEATQEEYLAVVEEIRARYPYPA